MSDEKDWSCDDYPDYCDEDGNVLDEYADKDEDELDDEDKDGDDEDKEDYVSYDSMQTYIETEWPDYDY